MSFEQIKNHMRQAAALAANSVAKPRHGLISSYDPDNHAVKVTIQPEGTETGWLPLKSMWIGNGWGLFCAPNIGDAVEVTFQEGVVEAGSAGHRFFNDEDRPLSVPAGEFWLVHVFGASIKLTNDKKLTVTDGGGSSVVMNGDGTGVLNFADGLTVNANKTTFNGDVHSTGTITGGVDVLAAGKSGKSHTHGGVQSGSAQTNPPT